MPSDLQTADDVLAYLNTLSSQPRETSVSSPPDSLFPPEEELVIGPTDVDDKKEFFAKFAGVLTRRVDSPVDESVAAAAWVSHVARGRENETYDDGERESFKFDLTPQAFVETGISSVQYSIAEVLHLIAKDIEAEDAASAASFRMIADTYYPDHRLEIDEDPDCFITLYNICKIDGQAAEELIKSLKFSQQLTGSFEVLSIGENSTYVRSETDDLPLVATVGCQVFPDDVIAKRFCVLTGEAASYRALLIENDGWVIDR